MSFRLNPLFLSFLIILVAASAWAYRALEARLAGMDVRTLVEKRAREILKADVKIGRVGYAPPVGLLLQEMEIGPSEEALQFSVASIRQLVLGYGLLNLIRRDLGAPSAVQIRSPEIYFSTRRSPFPFLDFGLSPSRTMPATLTVEGGRFHYPWGGPGKELVLSKVHFKVQPNPQGQIRIKLVSELEGIARGRIEIQGFTDANFRRYELDVRLIEATFLPESRIPLQGLNVRFHLNEKRVEIRGLKILLYDWEIQGAGKIEDWQTKPKISLELERRKGKPPFYFSLQMNFESEALEGTWSWAGRSYPFQGTVRQEGNSIVFPRLEMPHQYAGKGEVDISDGDYDFWFERDRRRIHLHSNLSRLDFETEFQLDHASINHLDWVVLGRARFTPLPKRTGEAGPRFHAQIHTDYLIIEFEPLQDFQGSFELSSEGIQAIDFRWSGGIFHLGGRILWRGGEPREDLVLRVDGFPLETIRDFGGRPIPENLRGTLEGKLKFRGEFERPEIQGRFTIKEGTIEKLDFDLAIIQFQGFPPQLRLYDSKIFRGRNTLKLTGVIDLRLENLFHGVQIQRSDHLVIWKGVSVYWKEGESAIQAEKPVGRKMAVGLEVGVGASGSKGEEGEEKHAVFGPRLKF